MLNPQWLNTFKTLVEVGHFTQTAEKLYMTQPGVSQHVKKLEQACGYALIKRINKNFELTEQGKQVYHYAIEQARNEQKLIEQLGHDLEFSGHCKLACSGSFALWLYPQMLQYQQQHLDLSFSLEAGPNRLILENVVNGSIDLGVVTDKVNNPSVRYHALGHEPLCLAMNKRYANETITSELLHSLGLVSHPDAKHYLTMYLAQCGDEALQSIDLERLKTSSYINQLNQILLPVSLGIGFTVLPYSAVEAFSRRDDLHIHQPKKIVTEQFYLAQKNNHDLPKRYQAIEELIKQKFS